MTHHIRECSRNPPHPKCEMELIKCIVIKCNLKMVDVPLNLLNNKPFSKPNNKISYIQKESNHPPSIIKQVPFSIESRLSSLSSSEKIFNESTPIY